MARSPTGPRVLTGNRLSDGAVVFLASDGRWVRDIAPGRRADTPEEAAALERIGAAASAANVIVDPYLVELEERDGMPRPSRLRERFRIAGPSVGHSLTLRTGTLPLQGRQGARATSAGRPVGRNPQPALKS